MEFEKGLVLIGLTILVLVFILKKKGYSFKSKGGKNSIER